MIYARKVSTTDRRFTGRVNVIAAPGFRSEIPVEDTVVLCDGCNQNLHSDDPNAPGDGYLVYLGKRELKADQPYDLFCEGCLKRYFPKHQLC